MTRKRITLRPDMTRQERIKVGIPERLDWPGGRLSLYWEVWGEVRPLRAQWIIELEVGVFRRFKSAFDDWDEAIAEWEKQKTKYAVDIAIAAMRLGRKKPG